MRTAIIAAAATVLTALGGGSADAQQAPSYVQAHGGAFFVTADEGELLGLDIEVDYDPGFALGALFGQRIGPNLAFEAEFTYHANDVDSFEVVLGDAGITAPIEDDPIDADVFTLMANAVYRLPVQGLRFTPYVGGGIGYADVWDEDDIDGTFAYQVKVGADVPMGANTFGVEARYLGTSDFETEGTELDYGGVGILATYKFGF